MDYTGLFIAMGIVIYGILTYQRREHRHRERMAYFSREVKPPEVLERPAVWKLVTVGTGGLAVLWIAARLTIHWINYMETNPYVIVVASIFFLLFMILALTFLRDLRMNSKFRRSTREVNT
jgi:hypothetical protein